MSTVADTIVAHLVAGGVRRVYGLPGDSLNGFTDALRRDGCSRGEPLLGVSSVAELLLACGASAPAGKPRPRLVESALLRTS